MMASKYSSIEDNLKLIRENIMRAAAQGGRDAGEVSIMAVTKTVPAEAVNLAIAQGIRLIGENRAQELIQKYQDYDKADLSIHFIGSLQTNKVRQIIDKVDMVQSLNSTRLAVEIEKQAAKHGLVMDVLIEVNIGEETSKSGIMPQDALSFADSLEEFEHLRLRGLMAIPPPVDQPAGAERYFDKMRQLFVDIKGKKVDNKDIDVLSLGMSGDYCEAIRHGSTLVRIGSSLFGARY